MYYSHFLRILKNFSIFSHQMVKKAVDRFLYLQKARKTYILSYATSNLVQNSFEIVHH